MSKKAYINEDFLLNTRTARELFHSHAENLPIIDYHCHLPPKEIAEDKHWEDIAEVWLGGDHYKWRQMRSNGIDEKYITGNGDWREKFMAYAATMDKMVGNPLFDWSQLELARYFGVSDILGSDTAEKVWKKCNSRLSQKTFSARGLMKNSNVKVVCTTDDPDDDLKWHDQISRDFKGIKVLPTWRPDRILKLAVAKKKNPMAHLAERHAYFEKHGCRISDYGLNEIPEGRMADYLVECMKLDAKAGWVSQLHFNCIRNPNTAMFKMLGPDTGFDTIGEAGGLGRLVKIFDRLEQDNLMPKTIVYSLNPSDTPALGALIGSFQKGPEIGKLQLGAAWWFNDHRKGMSDHLDALMALGCLGNFVGMLTDSRSFLSYTRHEYFRRILCAKLGMMVEAGQVPNDLRWLGRIIEDISFNNANRYFGFDVK